MKILSLKEVEGLNDKFGVDGACMVQNYTKQPTKNGGSYIGGILSTSEGTISFKAWSNSSAYKELDTQDLQGKIINAYAEVNVFNGMKSLVVTQLNVLTDPMLESVGVGVKDFMYSKYNVEAYWNSYIETVRSKVSENAFKVFELLVSGHESELKTEFAAISHHDNCKGGLIAHSLKVLKVAGIVKIYPNIAEKIGMDLLYVGCAVHDIGKIVEYSNGSMSNIGRSISHSVIGCLMIQKHEEEIISLMGEDFYYNLLSVVSGHHGEYGEHPRTLAAYIIHKIDLIDSMLTSIDELVEGSDDGRIIYDGFKLS